MRLIGKYWNSATVSALAAIFGSLVGALGLAISARIAQRHRDRQDILVKRASHGEVATVMKRRHLLLQPRCGFGHIFHSAAFSGTSFAWSPALGVKELNWDLPYQLQTSAK
jgi:hypothetical protein